MGDYVVDMDEVTTKAGRPIQGVGIGLRSVHYHAIETGRPDVPWFEVLADNYLGKGGSALHHLEQIRRDYPVTFHCIGMSLGSADPIDQTYLRKLKQLIDRFQPDHISDHLCWTSVGGNHAHDLLPLLYLEKSARHVADRIGQAQDYLGQRMLIENVSSYLQFNVSDMQEWEFVGLVAELADCDILLDVNNIHVSATNHDFSSMDYLSGIPLERVREIHLAGYEDKITHLLDTHGAPVYAPVWMLYREALERLGHVPTLIEWDTNIPSFDVVRNEAHKASKIMDEVCAYAA